MQAKALTDHLIPDPEVPEAEEDEFSLGPIGTLRESAATRLCLIRPKWPELLQLGHQDSGRVKLHLYRSIALPALIDCSPCPNTLILGGQWTTLTYCSIAIFYLALKLHDSCLQLRLSSTGSCTCPLTSAITQQVARKTRGQSACTAKVSLTWIDVLQGCTDCTWGEQQFNRT